MASRRLLVVYHSRSGSTGKLCEAVVAGTVEAAAENVDVRVLGAFDAGAEDVRRSDGVILGTPANFGYMSGALKDFFERIYHPLLEETVALPYALFVKGDTDADGAVRSVEGIVTGLRWRRVLPPVVVVGELLPRHMEAAQELGATFAAGLGESIF
jgi:multimeric flavodoxin WrbA